MKKLRIGYFADGPWAHKALAKMVSCELIEIAFICARNDIPDPFLKSEAKRLMVEFVTHPNINSIEFIEFLKRNACDLFVSMSFNQIFKFEVLSLPPLKTINCHAGKLPFYRGRNILNWALINDEKEFGITVHYVDEGIDTGDIILQECYEITDEDNYSSLLERSYINCSELLFKSIELLCSGSVKVTKQIDIHPTGTYFPQRKLGDENLDWKMSSREIFNFVRAISRPGPEARCFIGENEVKINRIELIPNAPNYKAIPGAVLSKNPSQFIVKTGDSYVKVIEWSSRVHVKVGDRFI